MLDAMTLSNRAADIRRRLGADLEAPTDILALVHSISGLTLVLYPLGLNISGVCINTGDSAVIGINSGLTRGRQRFALAHELYHHYFDEGGMSVICPTGFGGKADREREADLFASYLLMLPTALYREIHDAKRPAGIGLTMADVVRLEQHFGVSRHAMLMRLQMDGELSHSDAELMLCHVRPLAARLGYDTSLYRPTPPAESKGAYGHYVRQAENLLRAGTVSEGKYEQWLLEAFRDDIVFGDDYDSDDAID